MSLLSKVLKTGAVAVKLGASDDDRKSGTKFNRRPESSCHRWGQLDLTLLSIAPKHIRCDDRASWTLFEMTWTIFSRHSHKKKRGQSVEQPDRRGELRRGFPSALAHFPARFYPEIELPVLVIKIFVGAQRQRVTLVRFPEAPPKPSVLFSLFHFQCFRPREVRCFPSLTTRSSSVRLERALINARLEMRQLQDELFPSLETDERGPAAWTCLETQK